MTDDPLYQKTYDEVIASYRESWLTWIMSRSWRQMAEYDAQSRAKRAVEWREKELRQEAIQAEIDRHTYVAEEWVNGVPEVLHHIYMPQRDRRQAYNQAKSMEAFRRHSPEGVVIRWEPRERKEVTLERSFYSRPKLSHDRMPELALYGALPVRRHRNVWEFYEVVGWDRMNYKLKPFVESRVRFKRVEAGET